MATPSTSMGAGETADAPRLIGERNGADPILVEATGLAFGIHKGTQRWVTGTGVQPAIAAGLLAVLIETDPDYEPDAASSASASASSASASASGADADAAEQLAWEAAVTEAAASYDSERIADATVPKTNEWIGDNAARAAVVEERETAGQKRKGIFDYITELLADD